MIKRTLFFTITSTIVSDPCWRVCVGGGKGTLALEGGDTLRPTFFFFFSKNMRPLVSDLGSQYWQASNGWVMSPRPWKTTRLCDREFLHCIYAQCLSNMLFNILLGHNSICINILLTGGCWEIWGGKRKKSRAPSPVDYCEVSSGK